MFDFSYGIKYKFNLSPNFHFSIAENSITPRFLFMETGIVIDYLFNRSTRGLSGDESRGREEKKNKIKE